MTFDFTKAHRASQEMTTSGGDFVDSLGRCFFKADLGNARKLYDAFSPLFDQYYERWVAKHPDVEV